MRTTVRQVRPTVLTFAVAAILLAAATPTPAGIIVEDTPVSRLSANVVMEQGVPCIPLADLARALGGTLQVNLEKRLLVITPGPNGLLRANQVRLADFSRALKPNRPAGGQSGVQVQADAAAGIAAGQNAAILRIGGADVMFDEFELILLRPNPLMPLPLLGRLLGGTARLDPNTNAWVLPHGGPNDPLSFR